MKTIGNTNDGNVLVEMTSDEHDALTQLGFAFKDKGIYTLDGTFIREDLETYQVAFEVIRYWTYALNNVNCLLGHMEKIKRMMKSGEEQ